MLCPVRRTPRRPAILRDVRFELIDHVVEQDDSRIVAIKSVTSAEEYLQDHFPTFPVLPGVMMIEAMVQAARRLLEARGMGSRHVLSGVRALKYGSFVRPGESLRIEVTLQEAGEDGVCVFKGAAKRLSPEASADAEAPTSVSGRLTLRPVRL